MFVHAPSHTPRHRDCSGWCVFECICSPLNLQGRPGISPACRIEFWCSLCTAHKWIVSSHVICTKIDVVRLAFYCWHEQQWAGVWLSNTGKSTTTIAESIQRQQSYTCNIQGLFKGTGQSKAFSPLLAMVFMGAGYCSLRLDVDSSLRWVISVEVWIWPTDGEEGRTSNKPTISWKRCFICFRMHRQGVVVKHRPTRWLSRAPPAGERAREEGEKGGKW